MALATTDLLIANIVSILENEISSIAGVHSEMYEIKEELASMKSFLQDAEAKKAYTDGEETWIASVRDLAYDVEDIIDVFMYHVYEQGCHEGRFARWLHQTIRIPKNVWFRHRMANKLKKITRTIKAIPERNNRYGVRAVEGTSSSDGSQRWMRNQAESCLFKKEDELVGIEGEKKMLMGWLLNGEEKETVYSVVGMGGSGKTTLVSMIFTSETVQKHFNCYAWITVSQTYVIEDLFRRLIKEFHQSRSDEVPANLNFMSYIELVQILLSYLESKRFLVVLDDVWDIKLWKEIRISLPKKELGSRIILTTRNEDIASSSFGVESYVHSIQPLKNNDAWELFSNKAFSTWDNKCCPRELEPLAWELVEKCEGLPLAIECLGGLMASKKPLEWRKVYNSLNWHLANHPLLEPVKSILLLSFNDLPYRLKNCFLYCSLFPEDYFIRRKKLIRLWIAEGFVEHSKGITLEEVAENYLMELIVRSMLHVVWRNEDGRPKACMLHDLMRELALSTSEKEKFCAVYDGREEMEVIRARRLSTQTTQGAFQSCTGMSQLRTFLVLVTDMSSLTFSDTLPSGFKLLRVLDLEYVPIRKLPNKVVHLFNIRYLNLRGTLVENLPESIGRLCNLQTLDIRNTKILQALPRGIAKLLNLRHLIMYHYTTEFKGFRYVNGTRAPDNITMLKKLQVLSCVQAEGMFIRLLGNTTQLTRIGIANVKEGDEIELCVSIERMKLLHYLFLMASGEEVFLRTDALHLPPPNLRMLILVGKLESVPLWFKSLSTLTNMYLHWSRLEKDLLPHIEGLPNLRRLTLINSYVGEELCFRRGFANLTHLQLLNFPLLSCVRIEKQVMLKLQFLYLDSCLELKTLPHGLEYLTELETLKLESVSMQLVESIRAGGEDRPKVRHIPEILHYYETSYGKKIYEKLS